MNPIGGDQQVERGLEVIAMIWQPGQTCRWKNDWATVSYILPGDQALITLDDGRQATVPFKQLVSPMVRIPEAGDGSTRSRYGGRYR